jgi:hypothetical protein
LLLAYMQQASSMRICATVAVLKAARVVATAVTVAVAAATVCIIRFCTLLLLL